MSEQIQPWMEAAAREFYQRGNAGEIDAMLDALDRDEGIEDDMVRFLTPIIARHAPPVAPAVTDAEREKLADVVERRVVQASGLTLDAARNLSYFHSRVSVWLNPVEWAVIVAALRSQGAPAVVREPDGERAKMREEVIRLSANAYRQGRHEALDQPQLAKAARINSTEACQSLLLYFSTPVAAPCEDSARLDWLEANWGTAILPVEGNIMPEGTWAVDPVDGKSDEDVCMAPTLRAAIDAARNGSAQP